MAATVGDIIRMAFRQTYGVDDVVNVMHFRITAVPTLGGDALLLSDISNWAGDVWGILAPSIATAQEAVDINVYNVFDDAPVGVASFGSYVGGTASGEAMPGPAATLVLMPTGKKRTIGRMYLGVFTEGAHANGRWVPAHISDVQEFVDNITADAVGENGYEWEFGIYSRSDGVLRPPATTRVVPVVAYQRRRKPGIGS